MMAQQRGPVWTVVGGLATATTFFLLGRKTTPTTTTNTTTISSAPPQDEQPTLATVVVTMSSATAYHGIHDSKPTKEMLPAAGQHLRGDESANSSCGVTYELDGVQHEWGCPQRKRTFSYANTTIGNDSAQPAIANVTASGEQATVFTDTTFGFFVVHFLGVTGSISTFCLLILLTQQLGIALERLAGFLVCASETLDNFMEHCIDYFRMFIGRRTLAEATIVDINEELQRLRAKIHHYLTTRAMDQQNLQNYRVQQASLESELASQRHQVDHWNTEYRRELHRKSIVVDELGSTEQELWTLKHLSVQLRSDRDHALHKSHHLQTANEKLNEQLEAINQRMIDSEKRCEAMTATKIDLEKKLAAAQALVVAKPTVSVSTQTERRLPTPAPASSVQTQTEPALKITEVERDITTNERYKALEARFSEALTTNEDLDKEIEELQSDLENVKQAAADAEQAVKKAQQATADAEQIAEDMKKERDARGKALGEARRKRDIADKDATHYSEECTKAQKQLSALEDELRDVEAQKTRLENEQAAWEDEKNQLTAERDEFESEFFASDDRKDELEEELLEVIGEKNKWEARTQEGRRDITNYQHRITDLEAQLRKHEHEPEQTQSNEASLPDTQQPDEAVPKDSTAHGDDALCRSRKERQRDEAIAWGREHADEVRARQVDKSSLSQKEQKIWKWNRQGAGLS